MGTRINHTFERLHLKYEAQMIFSEQRAQNRAIIINASIIARAPRPRRVCKRLLLDLHGDDVVDIPCMTRGIEASVGLKSLELDGSNFFCR